MTTLAAILLGTALGYCAREWQQQRREKRDHNAMVRAIGDAVATYAAWLRDNCGCAACRQKREQEARPS